MQQLLPYSTVEEESTARNFSHPTLPSTLEGRMRRILLYSSVEEELTVSTCSHPTLPSALEEGRMQ